MATVLKSGDRDKQQAAAQNASAIAGFNLSDLADEGRTRLEQCRLQVQEMLAKAEQQVLPEGHRERHWDAGPFVGGEVYGRELLRGRAPRVGAGSDGV